MTRRLIPIALLAALLVAAGGYSLARSRPPSFHGTVLEGEDAAPGFALTDHTGTPRTLADYRGHAVLLFFGFTHCPDVCPLTLDRIRRALAELDEDQSAGVRVLLVTVDPARDTPAVLADYVRRFGQNVVGLTGDETALAAVRKGYGVHLAPGAHPGHPVVHSDAIYGIDREGRLRVLLRTDADETKLADDVAALLRL